MKSQLNVGMTPELYAALTRQAEVERRSRTEVVRHALEVYIEAQGG